MENSKIEVSFEKRILSVKFLENAIVDISDLEEIYVFGNEKAQNKVYGVIFEALNHYEITEDSIQCMPKNPNNKNILAKAYIVNTKEAARKTRLHLAFDNPELKSAHSILRKKEYAG